MSGALREVWAYLADSTLFWLAFTVAAYLLALAAYLRCRGNPLLLPVLTAVAMVVAVLYGTGTPYEVYAGHTWFLSFLIGPATVALAIPLYGQLGRLRQMMVPLCVALLAGSATAIVTGMGIAWMLGGSLQTQLSVAPKSATMPIAMEVAALAGGLPSLTTIAVAVTGIAGAILAGSLLRLFRIADPAAQGFSLGLSAHAIGVARAFQASETAGAFAALGMGLNGIATAVLIPVWLALLALF
ncbi:LrgB family protein [Parapusillimonas granuli]|uniref:LrgB family protein n=1 Tax=Parapusillimonas granuli TaxID=380911 RepID=A0A853G722_9BURK|nr:LrgB family protein [Parapusillimonas granuli]MBB5214040.1 putative effector of murein hydrolase [Parapusillimonas granuli]MEB2400889.1 LrgB family protein [Alcaligenaceae bacterium]NYT50461.1 LrgB family protein [Parapusillimonas granuli]